MEPESSQPPLVPLEIELSSEAAEALRVAAGLEGLSPGELASEILSAFPALEDPKAPTSAASPAD